MKKIVTWVLCSLMIFSVATPVTTLAKCAHKSTKWVTLTLATCTKDGKDVKLCKSCGKSLETKVVKKKGHRFYSRVVSKPTCTHFGMTNVYCGRTDCIYNKQCYNHKIVSELGHDYKRKIYNATCTKPKTVVKTCNRCKEKVYTPQGKALGHSWGEWHKNVITGKKTRVCSRCNKKEIK